MNQSISPGPMPAPRGLEKEEPELAYEEDIPSDDSHENDEAMIAPLHDGDGR